MDSYITYGLRSCALCFAVMDWVKDEYKAALRHYAYTLGNDDADKKKVEVPNSSEWARFLYGTMVMTDYLGDQGTLNPEKIDEVIAYMRDLVYLARRLPQELRPGGTMMPLPDLKEVYLA